MRTWWRKVAVTTAAAAMAAAGLVLTPGAAGAATAQDECAGTDGPPDLATATFVYSASSFLVGAGFCPQTNTYGEYVVTLHLTSFAPEVQVTAAFQDLGKYLGYSGYYVCTDAACSTSHNGSGFLTPPGTRLDGPCLYDVYSCPRSTTSAYGAWADVLPAGTAVPDAISWYAETRVYDRATQEWTMVTDRTPDSGTATAARNTATVATQVAPVPGPAPIWNEYGAYKTDTGRLTIADGSALTGRLVRIRPVRYESLREESREDGRWTAGYAIDRNATVRACFVGDGVHDPSCSQPYAALVKAFVSLDLRQSTTVRRGTPLVLKGVVRPHSSGQVRVLVREDRPGTTYRLLRYTNLIQNGDSYYKTSWTPTVRGRYVLRALWNNGSSADGAVTSNISTYRYVTVT